MTVTDTEMRKGCDAIEATLEDRATLSVIADAISPASTYYFLGCGSSYWVGTVAARLFRAQDADASAVSAPEFYFGEYPIDGDTVVVASSQSGETTETLRAFEAAADAGARTVAVTNTAGSTLTAVADHTYVTPAGVEESVLATKSVDTAVTAAYVLGRELGDDAAQPDWTPETCRAVADRSYSDAVRTFRDAKHTYTLGTGVDYGLAGEAARKFGEGPLLHSTPMPAMEISHGPLANVEGDPVLLVVSDPSIAQHYEPLIGELREAGARVVAIQPDGLSLPCDASVDVPGGDPQFLFTLKAIQRLTLKLATDRGIDPDNPPSLSKHIERDEL
ncbi:SIS domain-containing protein [Halorhabdus amylolytica]|uniref:SIS domain-containing protein n=1 Tax=Halorhabdus amylolytica TaxID=2559573 RepID=UPI0010AB4212|nr:SIS domain-containing protein [Halorhabdus amylolytica]